MRWPWGEGVIRVEPDLISALALHGGGAVVRGVPTRSDTIVRGHDNGFPFAQTG